MLQLRFQGALGVKTEHTLIVNGSPYTVRLETVSHCCTVLSFFIHHDVCEVPAGFAMVIPTPNGTRQVLPLHNRYFAMSHSAIHMLVKENKTAICICPQSFGESFSAKPKEFSSVRSEPTSLVSSEEVSRVNEKVRVNEIQLTEYIREEWGDCDELRREIEAEGEEKFYYKTEFIRLGVKWATYKEFVNDEECWCGQCAEDTQYV